MCQQNRWSGTALWEYHCNFLPQVPWGLQSSRERGVPVTAVRTTTAYVHHLLVTNELLAGVLLMMHNLNTTLIFPLHPGSAEKYRLAQLKELIRRQASWDVAVWLFTSVCTTVVMWRQPEVIITLNFNHLVLRLKSAQSRNICTELCPHEAKETSYDWNDLDWSEEIKTWPFHISTNRDLFSQR